MTPSEKDTLLMLSNKYSILTGHNLDTVKRVLWEEYKEGGVKQAKAFVDQGLSDMRLLWLAEDLTDAGVDPDEAIELLLKARQHGEQSMCEEADRILDERKRTG